MSKLLQKLMCILPTIYDLIYSEEKVKTVSLI